MGANQIGRSKASKRRRGLEGGVHGVAVTRNQKKKHKGGKRGGEKNSRNQEFGGNQPGGGTKEKNEGLALGVSRKKVGGTGKKTGEKKSQHFCL